MEPPTSRSQWITAAEQPPHLTAINPWEGLSDVYRDLVVRDGMPDIGFAERLQAYSYAGKNQREDILAEVARHPLMNDLWEDKLPHFALASSFGSLSARTTCWVRICQRYATTFPRTAERTSSTPADLMHLIFSFRSKRFADDWNHSGLLS